MDARLWSGERGRTLPILLAWFGCVGLAGPAAGGDDRALLRESLAVGTCTQVQIELKAEGLFRPGLPPEAMTAEVKLPKPLALDVKSRLVYAERILKPAPAGQPRPDSKPAGVKAGAGFVRRRQPSTATCVPHRANSGRCFPFWWPSEPLTERWSLSAQPGR